MLTRVTLSLDSVDVDLLDRLAELSGGNRSEQVRELLASVRPMLRQTISTMEQAVRSKEELLDLASRAEFAGLSELLPEVERIQNTVLGAMARLEGALAVAETRDPRPSNHGGHTPTPPSEETTS